MTSPRDDLVERLPTLPDDDSDFTPELGRKIIAGYHRIIEQQEAEIERLREALSPFANAASTIERLYGPRDASDYIVGEVQFGALQAARTALNSKGDGGAG